MFRSPVHVRDATPDDAAALVEVWAVARSSSAIADLDAEATPGEAVASVARIAADPDQRLLVAAHRRPGRRRRPPARGPLSPIHGETAVYVLHLHVLEDYRRHGVGPRAARGDGDLGGGEGHLARRRRRPSSASRDANRFMARLGLAQIAVVRGATVPALRAKLPVEPPAAARVGARNHRNVGQVLVQRRSMRRARTRSS